MPPTRITKRLRVFAGPNGSGKSTIINAIREFKVNNRPIDFGIYINADDIAQFLLNNTFTFHAYGLPPATRKEFITAAMQTGLINAQYPETAFKSSFSVSNEGVFALKAKQWCEHLAQLMATFSARKAAARKPEVVV